jgi:tRNA pseudouridine38-40 synthase
LRYFIEFAYNGKEFYGFQIQPDAVSVQETLNKALSLLFKQNIQIVGAGRTDSGVHAKQMYAHFDCDFEIDPTIWVGKFNSYLGKNIVIYRFIPVHEDAHSRFDAVSRTYEYYIHTSKDVFQNEGSWHCYNKLDVNLMNEACKILFEYKDFECFSKTKTEVNTFLCDITEANWKVNGNQLMFTISANRFLRNMVRAIVGTLINVGIGKISLDDFRAVIESKNRQEAGFSVPAHALYLVKVKYPYID